MGEIAKNTQFVVDDESEKGSQRRWVLMVKEFFR